MQIKNLFQIFSFCLLFISSCINIDEMNNRLDKLDSALTKLEGTVSEVNNNAIAINHALKDSVFVSVSTNDQGYIIETTDGKKIQIVDSEKCPESIRPVFGVNPDGQWTISIAGSEPEIIQGASNAFNDDATPKVRVDAEGYWQVTANGGVTWTDILKDGKKISAIDGKEHLGIQTFFEEIIYEDGADQITFKFVGWEKAISVPIQKGVVFTLKNYSESADILLGETINYNIESAGIASTAVSVPENWNAVIADGKFIITSPTEGSEGEHKVRITAVSEKGYLKIIDLKFNLIAQSFADILDFSYAGYKHGETAPTKTSTLGYQEYDITDYGADPAAGNNDRQAFLSMLTAIFGEYAIDGNNCIEFPANADVKAIIYFPAGEYVLHSEEDDLDDGTSKGIIIQAGNLILKGDGADKSVIVMDTPMKAKDATLLYSSPSLIEIKHKSSHGSLNASVTGNAAKGTYSVNVSNAAGIRSGDWVCLYVKNNTADFIAEELYPYSAEAGWENLTSGIEVIDYHLVESVSGNTITFYEPIMHKVESSRGWEVRTYPHYENVGIEDLCFKGHAKETPDGDFNHHGDWDFDGGYKPLVMNRLVNSWIRRVRFESTSEACSIVNSACVSAYNIEFTGRRGHSSIRSQASSRVLIAATRDNTISKNGLRGNYHGVGVSRQSIGAVLWRNRIGDDSCFESHASQPRATLLDCCTGGWHKSHQGGADSEFPHHLADLTIWNYKATKISDANAFTWWDSASKWYFLPPVIVGFQGGVTFDETQAKVSSHGVEAYPQSLYESQIKKRLGEVPSWLLNLK